MYNDSLWDDDFADLGRRGVQNNTGYYGGGYYGGTTQYSTKQQTNYSWGNWGNWGNSWNTSYSIEDLETRLKRKKEIKTSLDELKQKKGIVGRTYIGGQKNVSRTRGIYNITIPNTDDYLHELKVIESYINDWQKIPRTSYTDKNGEVFKVIMEGKQETGDYFGKIAQYFKGQPEDIILKTHHLINDKMNQSFLTEDDCRQIVNSIPPKVLEEIENEEEHGHGGITTDVSGTMSAQRVNCKLKFTIPPIKNQKESSLFRGKRINRGYITHTSYKPLITKIINKNKKKEILIIIDGSGSMTDIDKNKIQHYVVASNFAADLIATDLFKVNVIYSDDSKVVDVTKTLKEFSSIADNGKGLIQRTGGSEGFEKLTARLGGLPRTEDYVLIFTDMKVPTDAEENLKQFIGPKKHLVLSFGTKRQFDNLNVRYVQEHTGMSNVLTTLLA